MLNQLLEGAAKPTFFEQFGPLIILAVFLVIMFVWNFMRSKKYQKQEQDMLEQIKIGAKIKTYSGIYGTVVGFYDTTDGRVAKIALDGTKNIMEIDFKAIYGIDNKMTMEEYEKQKKLEEEQLAKEQAEKETKEAETNKDVKPEEKKVETKVEEAPVKEAEKKITTKAKKDTTK